MKILKNQHLKSKNFTINRISNETWNILFKNVQVKLKMNKFIFAREIYDNINFTKFISHNPTDYDW